MIFQYKFVERSVLCFPVFFSKFDEFQKYDGRTLKEFTNSKLLKAMLYTNIENLCNTKISNNAYLDEKYKKNIAKQNINIGKLENYNRVNLCGKY